MPQGPLNTCKRAESVKTVALGTGLDGPVDAGTSEACRISSPDRPSHTRPSSQVTSTEAGRPAQAGVGHKKKRPRRKAGPL